MWKNTHPSEDGEALRENTNTDIGRMIKPAALYESDPLLVPQWYAAYTTPRHEKSVARHCGQRSIEHYLPLYNLVRKWSDGSRVTVELPLFTGYVFVWLSRREKARILNVPGVLAVVTGTGGAPAALPDELIESLRQGLTERRAEPHTLLALGQKVRICSGALAGMVGVVERNKSGLRVVLTLQHIMRSIAVEVSVEDLEPVPAVAHEPGQVLAAF